MIQMFSRTKFSLATTNALRFFFIIAAVTVQQRYLGSLGASTFAISMLEAVWWASILIFAPIWGAISDITGHRKPLLMASIGLSAATIPFFGYTESTTTILALKFIMGACAAGFPPIALALVSEYGDKGHRGRNISIFNSSRSFGFIAGRVSSGILLTLLLFTDTFWFLGAAGLLALIASFFLEKDGDSEDDFTIATLKQKIKNRVLPSQHDGVFKKNGLIYLLIGITLRKAGMIGVFSLIVVYITQVKGLPDMLMGVLIALNPATQTIFMLVFGNLTDRFGRKKVFTLGFLLSIPVPIAFMMSETALHFAVSFIMLGFSFSAVAEGSTTFIGDVAPSYRQAEIFGFHKTAQGFAGIIGALTAGTMASVIGYSGMFLTMSGLMTLGFLIAYLGTTETYIKK